MKEIFGNIWDYHKQGDWIAITTNGTVKSNGECVMGRGVAKQAKMLYLELPSDLGTLIKLQGNYLYLFSKYKIITFPVKYNWHEKASIKLIEQSAKELVDAYEIINYPKKLNFNVYLVRPGCGNGQLNWEEVKLVLEKYLDDRFIVVEINTKQN